MSDSDSTDSHLEGAPGSAGQRATDAFELLGNETRLSILLTLWKAYEPHEANEPLSFTELRDRVGVRQGAQFNYHLDKLVGQFVRKTDDGYELRRAGHQLVRTVIAGAGFEEPTLAPTGIDFDCKYCGAPTQIFYEDEWLYHVCTECDGCLGDGHDAPEGTLSIMALDPAAFGDRSPEELFLATQLSGFWTFQSLIEGVCPECSGAVTSSLDVCDDHDADGVCTTCGRLPAVMAQLRCTVCKQHGALPPYKVVAHHPAVVAFYYDHGIDVQYDVDDFDSLIQRKELVERHEQRLVSADPPRVRVTIRHESDELQVTLDDDLDVVAVNE